MVNSGFNFAYRRSNTQAGSSVGGTQTPTLVSGVPTSPSSIDRQIRRQQSQWNPSPQITHSNGGTVSPIITSQISSSPITSPEINNSNDWKQQNSWNNDSTSPTEGSSSSSSSSRKVIPTGQSMERTPSRANESEASNCSNNDTVTTTSSNTICNETPITTNSEQNGSDNIDTPDSPETESWADQAQNEESNWKEKPEINDTPPQFQPNGNNQNNQNDEDGSTNNNNNDTNTSTQQNRNQYNNNRRNNVGLPNPPFF